MNTNLDFNQGDFLLINQEASFNQTVFQKKEIVMNYENKPIELFEVNKEIIQSDINKLNNRLNSLSNNLNELKYDKIEENTNTFKKRKLVNEKQPLSKRRKINKEDINNEDDANFNPYNKRLNQSPAPKNLPKAEAERINNVIEQNDLPKIISSISKNSASQRDSIVQEYKGNEILPIRFSQRTINQNLSDGTPLFENQFSANKITLYDILRKEGWNEKKSPVDLIILPDHQPTTFDNRRVACAKVISFFSHSITIKANVHEHTEKASQEILYRASPNKPDALFKPTKEIEKGTFGQAVMSRIHSNSRLVLEDEYFGFKNFPEVVTGLKGKGLKTIELNRKTKEVKLIEKSRNQTRLWL